MVTATSAGPRRLSLPSLPLNLFALEGEYAPLLTLHLVLVEGELGLTPVVTLPSDVEGWLPKGDPYFRDFRPL